MPTVPIDYDESGVDYDSTAFTYEGETVFTDESEPSTTWTEVDE